MRAVDFLEASEPPWQGFQWWSPFPEWKSARLGHERFHTQLNWEKSVEQLKAAYARALGQG